MTMSAVYAQSLHKLLSMHNLPETVFFFKSHFSESPQELYDHVSILHSKSLKKCHNNFENPLTNEKLSQKIILNRAFSIGKCQQGK